MTTLKPDLCILGMDPAGFDLALAASQLGAKVVVATLGQTTTSFARDNLVWLDARQLRMTGATDLAAGLCVILARREQERAIARLPGLGVTLIDGAARFLDSRQIAIGETTVRARRFVLAMGRTSSAFPAEGGLSPLIAGNNPPRAVRITGAKPESLVLAQVLIRFGVGVALEVPVAGIAGIDPEAVALAHAHLEREGVRLLREGAADGNAGLMHAIDLSVAPAALQGLDLTASGITMRDDEPVLDNALRTSNPRVSAIGQITRTRAADRDGAEQIGFLLGKLLLRRFGRFSPGPDMIRIGMEPEIITLGLSEPEAGRKPNVKVYRETILGDHRPGLIKVITDAKERVLGVSIVAERASEMAQVWAFALASGKRLSALGALPSMPGTGADAARTLALAPQRRLLGSARLQGLVRFMRNFG